MSIFSQCKESRRYSYIHRAEVIISTFAGYPTYSKNDLFENDETVVDFDHIIETYKNLDHILLHVPEIAVEQTIDAFTGKYKQFISNIPSVRINVMNQNINLMPPPIVVAKLFMITDKVTQTTAHAQYTTQELSNKYQTPVHHMSVFIDESQYKFVNFNDKENLIIYSPDVNENKDAIVNMLTDIEEYKTVEIKDLSYDDYKKLLGKAKYCITFGEGMDGYFVESYLSGTIGVAVYNDRFFSDEKFLELPGVFENYDALKNGLPKLVGSLENEQLYSKNVELGKEKIVRIYHYENYLRNLKDFYKQRYTFSPNREYFPQLVHQVLLSTETRTKELEVYNTALLKEKESLKKEVHKQKTHTKKVETELEQVKNSTSWKITRPLRQIRKFFSNLFT